MESHFRVKVVEHVADAEAKIAARVDDEAREYPQGTLLSTRRSEALLRVLDEYEADLAADVPWDELPPTLFAIYGARHSGSGLLLLTIEPLHLPYRFWRQADNPAELLLAVAGKAAAQPRWFTNFLRAAATDPSRPALGWGLIHEGWLHPPRKPYTGESANSNPSLRADEARIVSAVDVDERVYQVIRFRHSTLPRIAETKTPAVFERERLELAPHIAPPRVGVALTLIARLTAQESVLGHLLRDDN